MTRMFEFLKKWGAWLAGAVLVLLGLGFAANRSLQDKKARKTIREAGQASREASEVVGGAKTVLQHSEGVVKTEEEKAAKRKKRKEDLDKKLGGFMTVLLLSLIFLVAILMGVFLGDIACAHAQEKPTGDALMQRYLEAVEVAREYKALYEEAEASNGVLLGEIKGLQEQVRLLTDQIAKLQKWIDELMAKMLAMLGRKAISLLGGLTVSFSGQPTGAFVGASVGF